MCTATWLVPLGLVLIAQAVIPEDPDAPHNMFGPIGPRQEATVWIIVAAPVIWLLLSWLLKLGRLWILVAIAVAVALVLIVPVLNDAAPGLGNLWLAIFAVAPPVIGSLVPKPEVTPGQAPADPESRQ